MNLPRSRLLTLAALLAITSTPLLAAAPSTQPIATAIGENPDPSRYLFEDQLSPGMKGYGLTVMHGGAIEKFDVEIIDVVRNFSPGNNAILVRCSGLGLEHSGIIAGMSGSPVYIDNKMIGAVAYGWGMSKDPIGGVQPIRQMLSITAKPAPVEQAGGARWTTNSFFAHQAAALPGWKSLALSLGRRAGKISFRDSTADSSSLTPLISPLMVAGASPATLASLRQTLAGTNLFPLAGGSAGSTPDLANNAPKQLGGLGDLHPGQIHLQPGAAIAVPLVTGDMDLSAIGTVTEVSGDKVYAFGHAFMGDGGSQLPIATSYIYSVIPNVNVSFKMGTSIASTGTLVTDEETGIVGLQGKIPPTVPISFTVKHSDGTVDNTYHFQLAPHPHLTPELLTAIVSESLISHRALPHEFTAHLTGDIHFASDGGPKTISLDSLGTTQSFNPAIAVLPVAMLSDNPFENLKLTSMDLEATVDNTNRSAEITSITLNRITAAPGDELTATVHLTPFRKFPTTVPITLKIPDDAPDGDYPLFVGSSSTALSEEAGYAPQRFDPQDITSLTKAIQHLLNYKTDHLYATLVMNISGATVAGREHPNLPASRLALYANQRRNDTTPVFNVIQNQVATDTVIADGGQSFTIHVDRNANRRYFEPTGDHENLGNASDNPHPSKIPTTAPPPASAPSEDPTN